jgi:hypothetical protein
MALKIARTPTELDNALLDYQLAKNGLDRAKEEFSFHEERLLKLMDGQHSATVSKYKVTKVQRETVRIDEDKLKKILGAPTYNKTLKKVFDKTKLESLVSLGEVSVDQVASASDVVPSKAYLRITEVKPEEDESA